MALLAWLLIGGGAYLIWCAVTNKPPISYALAVFSGGSTPKATPKAA